MLGFDYFRPTSTWVGNAFLVMRRRSDGFFRLQSLRLPRGSPSTRHSGFARSTDLDTRRNSDRGPRPCAITVAEWLRGHLFSGLPWNTFGYLLASPLGWPRAPRWWGSGGLTPRCNRDLCAPAGLADDTADRTPWIAVGLSRGHHRLATFGAIRLGQTALCRRCRCDHSAEPAAGRKIDYFSQAAGDEPLCRSVHGSTDPQSRGAGTSPT